MKGKKTDSTLLIPGSNGWELWSADSGQVSLDAQTDEYLALDVSINKTKSLHMVFPVRELTSIGLWIPEGMEEDTNELIDLHIEKMGLMQLLELGTLSQHQKVSSDAHDKTLYCVDILKAPAEGTLPQASPSNFNISPRSFPFTANSVTLWQEFNRWVFAITNNQEEVIYYQGITSRNLGDEALQEIAFAITQLRLQQIITIDPKAYIIWADNPETIPEGYNSLEERVEVLYLQQKPLPIVPPQGDLLPADTRSERLAAKKRTQQTIIGSIAALLIIGLITYAVLDLMKIEKKAEEAQLKAQKLTSENQYLITHQQKWQELTILAQNSNAPLELLLESTTILPSKDVRITTAEFRHQPNEEGSGTQISIVIKGTAPNTKLALDYDESLQKHQAFKEVHWTNPAPSKKQNDWVFTYSAEKF